MTVLAINIEKLYYKMNLYSVLNSLLQRISHDWMAALNQG